MLRMRIDTELVENAFTPGPFSCVRCVDGLTKAQLVQARVTWENGHAELELLFEDGQPGIRDIKPTLSTLNVVQAAVKASHPDYVGAATVRTEMLAGFPDPIEAYLAQKFA